MKCATKKVAKDRPTTKLAAFREQQKERQPAIRKSFQNAGFGRSACGWPSGGAPKISQGADVQQEHETLTLERGRLTLWSDPVLRATPWSGAPHSSASFLLGLQTVGL